MSTICLPHIPPAREIPSTFTASFKTWWASGEKASADSEERLLRRLHPYYRPDNVPSASVVHDDTPTIAYRSRVQLSTPNHYLNTLSMVATNPSPDNPPPAVVLHGYGAGLGFFFRNLPTLAQWAGRHGTAVYALDWLGTGRSARVPFTVKAKRDDIPGRVHEAESFFVQSLEEWRELMGLEKMTLIGHSLGAYLIVVYALRYPTRVSKLILLSPAGVSHCPVATVPWRGLTDIEDDDKSDEYATSVTKAEPDDMKKGLKKVPALVRRLRMKLFAYLWEEGWSPFQVVRTAMFWGPLLIGKFSRQPIPGMTHEDTNDMHEYSINISLAKGSGEYCISHLLAPGAHARMPLVDRIDKLKIPVTFIYGDRDWMNPDDGKDCVERLRRAGNGRGSIYIIPDAGHCLHLDNAEAVNDLLIKELDCC